MKLRDWLEREGISYAEMGARIERTGEAVRRYALGERIPDRETMPKIVMETRGEVTANDFFDIGAPPIASGGSSASGESAPDSDAGHIGTLNSSAGASRAVADDTPGAEADPLACVKDAPGDSFALTAQEQAA